MNPWNCKCSKVNWPNATYCFSCFYPKPVSPEEEKNA